MKVQLERAFALEAPAVAAWTLLQDLEAVAGCMPGASITERIDERRYKGTVTVRLGPASLVFRGEVEVKEVDPGERSIFLVARGTDTTGTSGAAMDLRARVEDAGASGCRLVGASEVSVSGKAATFGGRLMGALADQLIQRFAANFAERLRSVEVPTEAVPAAGPGASAGEAPSAPAASPEADEPAAPGGNGSAPAASMGAPPAPREINGLAWLWAMLRDWVHHLFATGRA